SLPIFKFVALLSAGKATRVCTQTWSRSRHGERAHRIRRLFFRRGRWKLMHQVIFLILAYTHGRQRHSACTEGGVLCAAASSRRLRLLWEEPPSRSRSQAPRHNNRKNRNSNPRFSARRQTLFAF